MSDLLGGQVDATFMNINTGITNIKAGKLRALAVTSAKRSALLPEVPTLEELGIKGVTVSSWQAFAAPKGLPADIKGALAKLFIEAMADPKNADTLAKQGLEPIGQGPDAFAAYIVKDRERWARVAKQGNVKAE